MTKAELDDFKPGRGLSNCVLEARPLCEDFPQLLHQIILNGIKPPHHKVILSYMPLTAHRGTCSILQGFIMMQLFTSVHTDGSSSASMQQPQIPPTVPLQVPHSLMFSTDMNNKQLTKWLRNHPSLTGTDYEEDISKLRGKIKQHDYTLSYYQMILM